MDPVNRYHRQNLIPDWDQRMLVEAKVLILGVGAIGSYLATNLTLAGVGHLILVDFDTVEMSNLNRQLLFQEEDIGENKATTALKRLKILNPAITLTAVPEAMEKMSSSLIKDVTVIACCLDTFVGRRWANSLALKEKVPMVSGGMYAFLGDVQTIIPYETACFECQPLISQEKLAQACSPLGEARKDQEEEKKEAPLPSVSTLSSIISGLMSQEIIKLVMGIGKTIDNFLFYDGLNNSFTDLSLTRNKNCPICGENYQLRAAPALVFPGEKVADFRQRVALAFGMANPGLMLKGKFLDDTQELVCDSGDKIYAIDERLAGPMVLQLELASTDE
ncbi:MAG: HesA/MoeB/ThiF family protein [Candidatus Kariarchaeaceae archaeon]|jgi:adenylyltransferase/sulfurtransferase